MSNPQHAAPDAEWFEALAQSRRSIRRYTKDPVPLELVDALLESAIWAPSAHNRQPWRFAVLLSAEAKHDLATAMGARLRRDLSADNVPQSAIDADVSRSYARLTGAGALIVLCLTMEEMDTYPDAARSRNEWTMAVQSVAMAGQNLLLAAHARGLGACWMCAPLFCPDVVQKTLGLPVEWQPQGIVSLGYPDRARTRTRRPVEEVRWIIGR